MGMANKQFGDVVQFLADEILIQGESRIILCASAFYFRIPKGEWRDRLSKVKAAGYNCIDVYFPWNYHEIAEGSWDFSGEKDVEDYLKLAAELGLFVIARPGPYICSEWDMGSLPAYLLTKSDLVLREYNEPYLNYVKNWYDRILPILAKYQIEKNGSIIAMQLENELDFFDCMQVEPYICFLRDYAKKAGIEVPLIVCAGQCDIKRAGGLIDGVLPAINLYPDMREKYFEDKITHYVDAFRQMNLPLCITETHQLHFILRRELIAGAKMVAAYNQVGGTDFGFTTSVNNWGSPMTYMTHDYHFNGMLNPQGEYMREYDEAMLFSGIVNTFEKGISKGTSNIEEDLHIQGECELSTGINRSLNLYGGGKLAAIANIDEKPGKVNFTYNGTLCPQFTDLLIPPLACPILPFDVPLSSFGFDGYNGQLAYSTAELFKIEKENTSLYFYTETEGEIALFLKEPVQFACNNMEVKEKDSLFIITFTASEDGSAVITSQTGWQLTIKGISKEKALTLLKDTASNMVKRKVIQKSIIDKALEDIKFRQHILGNMGEEISNENYQSQKQILPMEDMGYYKGYGWYQGIIKNEPQESILGYLIYSGMDILHFYRNDTYVETVIGDGTYTYIKEKETDTKGEVKLGLRCEIWGHCNFSDSRLPAMDIRRKKGIQGLSAIKRITDITDNWFYLKGLDASEEVPLLSDKDIYNPIMGLGGYNNPEQPQIGIYKKKIKLDRNLNNAYLIIENFNSTGKVYADGNIIKAIQPYDRVVQLEWAEKNEIELAIFLNQKMIQESKDIRIFLYEGTALAQISCCGAEEKKIKTAMDRFTDGDEVILKNLKFESGKMSMLRGEFITSEEEKQSIKLSINGRNVKVLVLLNGTMLGRLWLPSDKVRPEFRGGDENILYLPKCYMKEENTLDFLVEGLDGDAYIEDLVYIPVLE